MTTFIASSAAENTELLPANLEDCIGKKDRCTDAIARELYVRLVGMATENPALKRCIRQAMIDAGVKVSGSLF